MQKTLSEVCVEERILMFVDVHNYSLAFGDPLKSYGFLQAMYETLGNLIVEANGEIIKYLGDALLSYFPLGHAEQAVACGLQLRKAFVEMVVREGLWEEIELEVGIGEGPVVIGICGHPTLRCRDVFGDEVNRVARIGHYRGVAITEKIFEQIKTSYRIYRLPDLVMKKTGQPLQVWAVVE